MYENLAIPITEKINSLDNEKNELLQKKDELEKLLKNQGLSQLEFDNVKKLALSFGRTFDAMDIEQKRKALRTLVNKIVWDGENVHLYLFGASDDKFPASVIDTLEPQCEDSKSNENAYFGALYRCLRQPIK